MKSNFFAILYSTFFKKLFLIVLLSISTFEAHKFAFILRAFFYFKNEMTRTDQFLLVAGGQLSRRS